jgi:hypothetical protein
MMITYKIALVYHQWVVGRKCNDEDLRIFCLYQENGIKNVTYIVSKHEKKKPHSYSFLREMTLTYQWKMSKIARIVVYTTSMTSIREQTIRDHSLFMTGGGLAKFN